MSEADPIRVLVVDDQDLVRGGFKAILGTYEGIEIVGEARNGADAVQEAQRLRPDVVLMDIRMPEMNGIEATRAITGNPLLAKTRVLVLTTFDVDEYVYDALGAGASGFLLKDADPDEIVAETRRAALTSLTDREREILVLVARGLSNDEIAEELFISPATVKTHLARVMAKTDAHDRAQLVVFAYETGLVTPAP